MYYLMVFAGANVYSCHGLYGDYKDAFEYMQDMGYTIPSGQVWLHWNTGEAAMILKTVNQ